MKESATVTVESEVKDAVRAFRSAVLQVFKGNAQPMSDCWSHSQDVLFLDAMGGRQVGWEAVRVFFEKLAANTRSGDINMESVTVRAADDIAFCASVEQGEILTKAGQNVQFTQRATSIFRREDGELKLIYHHDDVSQELKKLSKK